MAADNFAVCVMVVVSLCLPNVFITKSRQSKLSEDESLSVSPPVHLSEKVIEIIVENETIHKNKFVSIHLTVHNIRDGFSMIAVMQRCSIAAHRPTYF